MYIYIYFAMFVHGFVNFPPLYLVLGELSTCENPY